MSYRRFFKFALLSSAALLAGGALVLSVVVDRAASGPELKTRIEEAASDFLGRPVTIDVLEWRPWPSATLIARNFRLYEDPLKRRLLVDAPLVEARVAVLSVFKLAAGITELRFVSPRVSLRRDKNGEWNAARVAAEIAVRPDEPRRQWGSLAFNWFSVEGATLTFEDDGGTLGPLPPLGVSGRGKLRFGRRHLHFPFELSGRLARSAATLDVSGDLGGRTRLRAEVKDGEASLAGLAWPPAGRWNGRWDGTLLYDERPAPAWSLRLRAAPLVVSTSAPRLDLVEATAEYVSATSSTFAGVARSSATEIRVKGSLRDGALDLDVNSPGADLGALLAFAGAVAAGRATPPKDAARPAKAASGRLTAAISLDDLKYGGTDLRGLRAVVRRSTGPYTLERLAFQDLGGTIEASGAYDPASRDEALRLAWKSTGLDVQELFRLAGSSLEAAGIADCEGSLVTGLGDRFLPALNGTLSLDLKNGWFGGMPGLLKVLTRLNLATLFAEASGRRRSRVPFDEARGSVTITMGKAAAVKPLVLKNKTLEMAFMGTYDLPARTVDGRIVVNFLTVTDEIIGLIPGVRDILLGGEKGLIPIWVRVRGKADDPSVEVLSARTIAAPAWNTVRHILQLPKRLFKELTPPTAKK